MKKIETIFNKNKFNQNGGMLVELLLTLALVAIILPFIISFQKSRVERAENIAITKHMEIVQSALEKYIDFNKKELLKPVGENITRVEIKDLTEYGADEDSIKKYGDNFQMRVVKSKDQNGHATLQGFVVLNDKDISTIRTREITNLGNGKIGFVEKGKAYGGFGIWHGDAVDFGIEGLKGIVGTTGTTLDSDEYLLRMPSDNISDGTMLSNLNLGKHNIVGAKFLDSDSAKFEEILKTEKFVSDKIIFQNRAIVDKNFESTEAVVAGALSSDSRGMEISNTINLADSAKFSNFITDNLWTTNLNLSGLSISSNNSNQAVILKINNTVDMVAGNVTALFVTVGFDGSITPKLVINNRIEDSTDSNYYWDVSGNTANFSDVSFGELNRMAALAVKSESGTNTSTGQAFNTVVSNKNATASDFMNAVSEIQKAVKSKYSQLNLD